MQPAVRHSSLQLHEQSKSFDVFETKLGEIGADLPSWFIKNLDRLIVTMHPRYKRKAAKAKAKGPKTAQVASDGAKSLQARRFPGLSVPDQEWTSAEKYVEQRKEIPEKMPALFSMDETMAELAAVAATRNRPTAEDFFDSEPSAKRPRHYDRSLDEGRRHRDNGYASRDRPGPVLDERPVLYKIYNGVVQNIRDFGAFVSLDGLQGRVEGKSLDSMPLISGMVHVSNITGTRIDNPASVLRRNDRVKVKVMSVAGNKFGLSMKDVDQNTGADLS